MPNNPSNLEIENSEKTTKKPSRRKRGYDMREAELTTIENNDEENEVSKIKNDKIENNNLII